MKRDYENTVSDQAVYFVGFEVEKTPAYGKKTLFVTGVRPIDEIIHQFKSNNCEHIFFGANHSFDPGLNFPDDEGEWNKWESMVKYFLKNKYLCSLDIPIKYAEEFHETFMNEYINFIPQLRVPVPYVRLWNYNTMIKIDDRDFESTNPGVWCHTLHELTNRKSFTNWEEYKKDKILD